MLGRIPLGFLNVQAFGEPLNSPSHFSGVSFGSQQVPELAFVPRGDLGEPFQLLALGPYGDVLAA